MATLQAELSGSFIRSFFHHSYNDLSLFNAQVSRNIGRISEFSLCHPNFSTSPQDFSTTLWAIGTLKLYPPEAWLEAVEVRRKCERGSL